MREATQRTISRFNNFRARVDWWEILLLRSSYGDNVFLCFVDRYDKTKLQNIRQHKRKTWCHSTGVHYYLVNLCKHIWLKFSILLGIVWKNIYISSTIFVLSAARQLYLSLYRHDDGGWPNGKGYWYNKAGTYDKWIVPSITNALWSCTETRPLEIEKHPSLPGIDTLATKDQIGCFGVLLWNRMYRQLLQWTARLSYPVGGPNRKVVFVNL